MRNRHVRANVFFHTLSRRIAMLRHASVKLSIRAATRATRPAPVAVASAPSVTLLPRFGTIPAGTAPRLAHTVSVADAIKRSESFSTYPAAAARRIDSCATLSTAANLIVDAEQPLRVVTGDRVVGVVTEREILRGAVRGATSVADVFIPIRSATPNTSLQQALSMMAAELLPVADPVSGQTSLLRKLDLLVAEHSILKDRLAEAHIHDG